jgi:hypothetical protein
MGSGFVWKGRDTQAREADRQIVAARHRPVIAAEVFAARAILAR